MKKIIKNINLIIIIIILLMSTILIGSAINQTNIYPVFILIGIYSIIYFSNKMYKKEKIKISKIDICIIILMMSSFIPLIFKTYVSLSNSIYGIIKSISILSYYLIAKNEIKKHPEYKGILICTIIISIIILCAIGIDEISNNYLEKFKEEIGFDSSELEPGRINSLLYANTMGIVTVCGIFLCIGRLFNTKDKITYIISIAIMLITLILTYSRLVYVVFFAMMILVIFILCKKFRVKLSKKSILIGCLILLAITIYIIIGLQIPDSLNVTGTYSIAIYDANSDEDYVFTLDITSEASLKNSAVIKITEANKYFDNIKITTFKIGGSTGTEEFEIHTDSTTSVIYIDIENQTDSKLIIENAKLNGEEFILKYRLLPTKIVQKVKSISLKNKNAWERLVFIEDTIKLIKENWIFGYGAGSWQTLQFKVQDYYYFAHEVHCFILQTFLENGIIGFSAIVILGIVIIKNLMRNIKKINKEDSNLEKNKFQTPNITNIFYMLAIIAVCLHSLVDFNMSFVYVEMILLVILAVINFEEKEYNIKFSFIGYLFILIISASNLYLCTIETIYKNDETTNTNEIIYIGEENYEKYYKYLPYNYNLKIMKYYSAITNENTQEIKEIVQNIMNTEKYSSGCINLSFAISYCDYQEEIDIEFLEYLLNYVYETEDFSKYIANIQIQRFQAMLDLIEILDEKGETELAEKFEDQLKKEVNEKESFILDWEKCRYAKIAVVDYTNYLEEIKENINERDENR